MKHILAFSGSARKGSFNTALAFAFIKELPSSVTAEVVDFSDIPLFNQDLEVAFPAVVTTLKDKIKAADGIVFVTPEYNRSIPGYFKNMIDWTSRPYGDSAWKGKPALIMGASGAATGTTMAQKELRAVLLYLDMKVMGQPETYVALAHTKFETDMKTFSTNGTLIDADTKEHLAKAAASFAAVVG